MVNFAKAIVSVLLISSILVGFLGRPEVEKTSALFQTTSYATVYSTVTSTSCYYWYTPTATSTSYTPVTSTTVEIFLASFVIYYDPYGWMGGWGSGAYYTRYYYATVSKEFTTSIPVATYTFSELRTRTYAYTRTTAYESGVTVLSVGPIEAVLLCVLFGLAISVVLFLKTRRPLVRTLPRRCVGCNTSLEEGEDFCPNCGRKRE